MYLSFKPDHIVSKNINDEVLLSALKEAFDLRLRRHDQPKTAELKKLLLQIVPMEEIQSLGTEHMPYFLDCYSAWLILEYLHRNKKISMLTINLQKMFDFEYLDGVVRKYEEAYVSMIEKMRTRDS